MNIDMTENVQAQSSHYSGAPQTCHCIIFKGNDAMTCYVNHISDDKNHSVMTFTILRDNIEKYPEFTKDRCLVLHSDNASSQYKCKYMFYQMKELAKEFELLVCWFYGEPGHGKGTIDAMSSFGCNALLRSDIIRNDNWFENAEKIVVFLKAHFEGDDTKHHYLVDA